MSALNHPIPKAVRQHGKIIDPQQLEPGDLLLLSKTSPPWHSKKIQAYQKKLFGDEDACWHHAAVSGGSFEICEATAFGGVVAHEYWKYMTGEYEIKVRRLKDAPAADRYRVAYYAATSVNTRYGFGNILGIIKYLSGGAAWSGGTPPLSSGVICSQLYFEACMRAGYLLTSTVRSPHVCPAHLSMSSILVDVPFDWISI